MKILGVMAVLLLCYVVWQYVELQRFGVTEYQVSGRKLMAEHKIMVLADLHSFTYGKDNARLIKKIKDYRPELILIAGDMMVSKYPETYGTARTLLEQLVRLAPVYYGFGNHESRAARKGLLVSEEFLTYLKAAEGLGVTILRNENQRVKLGADTVFVGGLEIALAYYEKGQEIPMDGSYVREQMGAAAAEDFQILLAHNPQYSEQYAAWGADLTFCGHDHGGLIRIPGHGSLISPQLKFFPKYNGGRYDINGKTVIVSRGLGTHTFHIRIFNRAELVAVRLLPPALEKEDTNG